MRELGQFADLRVEEGGGLGKKGGGAFEMGVDTPMHTMRMLTGMGFNTLSAHFCD